MSFRSRPVGWRHESYRHYLAAKGISTSMRDTRLQSMYLAAKVIRSGYFVNRADAKMLTLYHGTTREALPHILKEGLVAQEKGVRGEKGFIHLTPSMKIAKEHAGGSEAEFMSALNKELETGKEVPPEKVLEIQRKTGGDPIVLAVDIPIEELRASPDTLNATVSPFGAKKIKERFPDFPKDGFYRYEYVVPNVPKERIRVVPESEVIRKSAVKPIDVSTMGKFNVVPTWKNKALRSAFIENEDERRDRDRYYGDRE